MGYRIEIQPMIDPCTIYYDENGRTINFDFRMKTSIIPFVKGEVYLFPESFSNWSDKEQHKLTVFEYIKVLKRVIHHFKINFPDQNIFIEGDNE